MSWSAYRCFWCETEAKAARKASMICGTICTGVCDEVKEQLFAELMGWCDGVEAKK